MDNEFWEEVSYVERSRNREQALRLLLEAGRPMTPTELGDRMDIVLKSASRAVRQLHDHGLVECVNPDASRDRRYRPTEKGRTVLEQLASVDKQGGGQPDAFAEPPLEYDTGVPEEVQEAAKFVQMSPNRKSVMRHLASSDAPLTPTELAEELDTAFNSVSRALRQLAEREVVECITPESDRYRRYALTETGERVYRLLTGED